jgi:hypothetical protein
MSPVSIILTIFVIIFIYYIFKYIFTDPYTLNSLNNGQTATTISTDKLKNGGLDSNFSYSIWFYVNDWNYNIDKNKVIFGRMDTGTGTGTITDVSGINPSPLVVLTPMENNLDVYLKCQGITEPNICSIANIPIQKWVNLLISVYNRTMDLYLDGKLVRTCLLPGVPQISNTDVQITPNGGFNGWTSKFQYFPSSLNPQDAWNIYIQGYGGNMFSNLIKSYQVQFSILENGVTYSSVTI